MKLGKEPTHNEETKKKISPWDALKGQQRPSGAGSPSQAIEVRRSRPASQALILKMILLLLIIQLMKLPER